MTSEFDIKYGVLRPPKNIDDWEQNVRPVSLTQLGPDAAETMETLRQAASSQLIREVAKNLVFLWAMDAEGNIAICVEELAPFMSDDPNRPGQKLGPHRGFPRRGVRLPAERQKLGHPCLLDGGEARIAGEIYLDGPPQEAAMTWFMNTNSGRFCEDKPPARDQLENAAALIVSLGLPVEIDYVMSGFS